MATFQNNNPGEVVQLYSGKASDYVPVVYGTDHTGIVFTAAGVEPEEYLGELQFVWRGSVLGTLPLNSDQQHYHFEESLVRAIYDANAYENAQNIPVEEKQFVKIELSTLENYTVWLGKFGQAYI